MKYLHYIALAVICMANGQNPKELSLKHLALPSAPAFTLMDITPSSVVMPQNLQSFSIQTINAFAGDSADGLSNNNYAVEIRPYLYAKLKSETFLKYNGILMTENNDNTNTISRNVFTGVLRKASVSLALMNGTFEVFDQPQSYVSVGARTRLIEVKSGKTYHEIIKSYKSYEAFMLSKEVKDIALDISIDDPWDSIPKLAKYKETRGALKKNLEEKPLFALDVASAYSYFMGDKSQNLDGAFGRFGIWGSTDLAFKISEKKSNYFHVYSLFRYLRDGLNRNSQTQALFTTNNYDVGGKAELEFDKLSIGFEYLIREGDTSSSRTFGNIKYKINDAFAIHGGFGENFLSDSNLITLFGIQWGLQTSTGLALPTPRR